MRYYIGIDGGGTKTHLKALSEEKFLLGEGFGGASNLTALPKDAALLRGKGGYFYEYELRSLEELCSIVTEQYQTITCYGIPPEEVRELVLSHGLRGIDRVVPVGKAMDIGIIWDGYDLVEVLSRVVAVE